MLVLEVLKGVFLTSKANSFLKKIFFKPRNSRLGLMLTRREKEIGINIATLGKRPPLRVFQIDVPTCDSVQIYPTFAIYMGCNPFLWNQNLPNCHLGFCKSPSASSLLYHYSLHNLLLFLWCKILLLIDITELSNS